MHLLLPGSFAIRTHPVAAATSNGAVQPFPHRRVEIAARVCSGRRETVVPTPHRRSGICRGGGLLLAALSCWAAGSVQPAAAQSLFEALFGGAPHYARPEPLPPQTSFYADPLGLTGRDSRRPYADTMSRRSFSDPYGGYGGHGTAFCVRTCDGRYFPM